MELMKKQLAKYARLIVKTGLNLEQSQTLVISSPIECADFTRLVAEAAYKEGARDVVINWKDELFSKLRFLNAPEEVFEEFPEWQKEFYLSYMHKGAAFLTIAAADPELLKDVNPARIMKAQKVSSNALKEYRQSLMSNKNAWCIVSIPTKSWAQKVFSHLPQQEAVEKLWQAIFKAVRVDAQDPVVAWEAHKSQLKQRLEILNTANIKRLHYTNSIGTDLTIELPDNHLWLGGAESTAAGVEFVANMPTEEVFTVPHKLGANGLVVNSKPLIYNGNIIDNFSLTFKEGKVVAATAGKGGELLQKLVATDEGSCYLGEVALVPFKSPISDMNILFYNTLFDENASCHLALGKGYPVCVKNGKELSKEELEQNGVNDSLVHEDFMIGTADLKITAETRDGKKMIIFENGSFAI